MEELLLGYLLGALDETSRQRVEARLRSDPEARACLERIRQALEPLDADRADPQPPPNLAANTLAFVANHAPQGLPTAPAPRPSGGAILRWNRRADWVAAAVLLILCGGLGASLLAGQWRAYRRTACAENLRVLWNGLNAYADLTEGMFPHVEADGPRAVAGVFLPTLRDQGVLQAVNFRCDGGDAPPTVTLTDLDQLYRDDPERYHEAARELGGTYAYSLGFRDGDGLRGLSQQSGDTLPILADQPMPGVQGNSRNHGGGGQNVLYVGGVVRWCSVTTAGENGDDIYVNQCFQVRAGLFRSDTVLGAGDATPSRPARWDR
jgi:hypothetical protein